MKPWRELPRNITLRGAMLIFKPSLSGGEATIELMECIKAVQAVPNYMWAGKISAIKAVREVAAKSGVRVGLADAKYFVEFLAAR